MVTSIHFFEGTARGKLHLLRAFGILRVSLASIDGVVFAKAMGCGRGVAFSLWPDWFRYALIIECKDKLSEQAALAGKPFLQMRAAAERVQSWRLYPIKKKGLWDGQSPFTLVGDDGSGPLAVLTRAQIALSKIPQFIRHSYATTEAIKGAPGLLFSIGMGELPLVRQATFTIWEGDAAMTQYAYKNERHIAAIKSRATTGMFVEEIFVRFRIVPLLIMG